MTLRKYSGLVMYFKKIVIYILKSRNNKVKKLENLHKEILVKKI